MKTLLKINKIAFYTTLILFPTLYLGLFAQIPLGMIQLISAAIYSFRFFNKSEYIKKYLTIYWIIAIIELVLLYIIINSSRMSDSLIISLFVYVIFSMGIATYFLIIITKFTNNHENTN